MKKYSLMVNLLYLIIILMLHNLTTWNSIDSIVFGFIAAGIIGVTLGRLLQKRIWHIYEYE